MSEDHNHLNHTTWECKYHVVFTPNPADWTHGLARPLQDVLADPNPNLNVHLLRPPIGPWIGIRAATQWLPERGAGFGRGVLVDGVGEIGAVSMSVALAAFSVSSEPTRK